jgi:hypothetical protein
LVKLTSLSAKALFYKEQSSLKHKVLAIEEGAGAEDASYAIRNLISSDGLTSEVAMRDPQSGKLTTMANTVEGPVVVFCTTTDPEVDPETKSRFLVTGIDESREQTRKILAFQRQNHTILGLEKTLKKDSIIKLRHNFQRLLQPLRVINPHIDALKYCDDRLQGRRAQPQYLNIINTVAFLRQFQKEILYVNDVAKQEKIAYIEVDELDIEIGNSLAVEILGKTLDELSIPARDLLQQIKLMLDKKVQNRDVTKQNLTFTRRDVRAFSSWSNYRVHTHLKELISLEYIVMENGSRNSLQTYRMVYCGDENETHNFLEKELKCTQK